MRRDAIGPGKQAGELGGLSVLVIALQMVAGWAGLEMTPEQAAASSLLLLSIGSWLASRGRDRKAPPEGKGGQGGQGGTGGEGHDGAPGGQGGVGGRGGNARAALRALLLVVAVIVAGCAAKVGPVAFALGDSRVTYCPADEARLEDCPEVRGGQMSAGLGDLLRAVASMVPLARPAPVEPPTVIVQPEGVGAHEHRTGGPE